jgi:hypothetical protein
MSVERKVTIPEGGAKGMIGVDGTATMNVQSTKSGHREGDLKVARSSPFSLFQRFYPPTFGLTMRGVAARLPDMYVHRMENLKLVKIGQNWYYSLHA